MRLSINRFQTRQLVASQQMMAHPDAPRTLLHGHGPDWRGPSGVLVLDKGVSILSCRLRVAGVRFVRTAPYSPNCVIEDATVRSV